MYTNRYPYGCVCIYLFICEIRDINKILYEPQNLLKEL